MSFCVQIPVGAMNIAAHAAAGKPADSAESIAGAKIAEAHMMTSVARSDNLTRPHTGH